MLRHDFEISKLSLNPKSTASVSMDVLRGCSKIGLMENMPKRVKSKARRVKRLLERKPTNPTLFVPSYAGKGGLFGGFEFDEVYTDGLWKENVTTRSFLSGEKETTSGGGGGLEEGRQILPDTCGDGF